MSKIVGYRVYRCEFCKYAGHFESALAKHLEKRHNIDIYSEYANKGYTGDILIVSDVVIPVSNAGGGR